VRLRAIGWAAAAIALMAASQIATARPLGYDLAAYTDAARRIVAGEDLYPLATRDSVYLGAGEYLYPPLTAVLFIPLTFLPAELARAVWTAGLVVLAGAIGVVLVRPVPGHLRPWAVAAYALYLPLIAEVTLGNLNLVSLALCMLAWRWRDRVVVGGAALTAAVALKLVPIALPLFFVAAGRWRVVAAATGLGAAALLLTLPRFADEWRAYIGLALEIAAAPATQAVPLIPSDLPIRLAMLAAALGILTLAGRAARRDPSDPTPPALALAAMLFAAPAIWYPYLVFLLPLLAAVVARSERRWPPVAALIAYAALEIPTRSGGAAIAFIGLAAIVAAGLALVPARSRAPAAPARHVE
jgi:alpha-1,2-mannosyltransferase